MREETPVGKALPDLMCTQLAAAGVYAHFLRLSSAREAELWEKMLMDELTHVEHLRGLMRSHGQGSASFPYVNVVRLEEVCEHAVRAGSAAFLLRLEWALRLECAELDYGLEGLAVRRLDRNASIPGYAGDMGEHMAALLREAGRYAASQNINLQMRRLTELLDTCMAEGAEGAGEGAGGSGRAKNDEERLFPGL